MSRPSGRKRNEIRGVSIETNINKYAEGSCLITCGGTKIMCTATVDEKVPPFLRNTGKGWVTAEYSMLPRATQERVQREISRGKPDARSSEISRLIGRSLRAAIDLDILGERQIIIDCDVLQADGGTRCASITGGFVALYMAVKKLEQERKFKVNPINNFVAAVSCGVYKGITVLDLDYEEDSNSEADVNFILNDQKEIIEVQGTAEGKPFYFDKFAEMYDLATEGIIKLVEEQKRALGL